jgi:hypothetical protein
LQTPPLNLQGRLFRPAQHKARRRRRDGPKAAKPRKAAKLALLAVGNPQIAKAYGDAPVQTYIATMPGWKHDVGRERTDEQQTQRLGVFSAVAGNSVAN